MVQWRMPTATGSGRAEPASEVTIAVRVKPRASRTAVGGGHLGTHGPALVVSVRDPAVDGRATKATIDAVAEALGVPRARIRLRAGEQSRDKLLTITDPPTDLVERVRALRDGAGGSSG
jgi:uncharacterized protein YggU (UPF0235/DUF167 family)